MAGREVREYTNLSDPKDKKWGKGKDKIDDEDISFQRMVAKMQEVAGERGGYLHGRGALDSDDLLYLKEQMEAEEDAERLLRHTEKRAFAAFKRAAGLADTSIPSAPFPHRVEPKPKSGIRQKDLLKKVVEIKPKRQKVSSPTDGTAKVSCDSVSRNKNCDSQPELRESLYRSNLSPSQSEISLLRFLSSSPSNSPTRRMGKQYGGAVKKKDHRASSYYKRFGGLILLIGLVALFFVINWWMLYRLNHNGSGSIIKVSIAKNSSSRVLIKRDLKKIAKLKKPQKTNYGRLLAIAAHAMAENKPEPKGLWEEPYDLASSWKPCAEQCSWESSDGNNGYVMVTANGGLNQQRVAVCNAVAVARLLNATLVIPRFMYSSVWRDVSQFSDIYQEDHFINYLKPDIQIVKELPTELQSLDLEAIGSVVADEDVMKEAKPSFFRRYILPILIKNRVVHFIGFANRLSFDPIPFELQRLRCRCNFHALQFVPKIQQAGALILQRMRRNSSEPGLMDQYLVGPYAKSNMKTKKGRGNDPRFLALHLRFEIDMVAHSLCEFGGGEEEKHELEVYRQIHFPALTLLNKSEKLPSPMALRAEGLCPLTPEEAVLMLAALGFKRDTHIFLAGAQIYGGRARLASLSYLYPNLVTKENLLSPAEMEPFSNFSSQLAALDFIGSTAASAFAMTDSGSQLSALVSGYRMYYGGGEMLTIRPNKRRLADIFLKNNTIEWKVFQQRMRKAVRQTKQIHQRPTARSVYRHPRCKECMCQLDP